MFNDMICKLDEMFGPYLDPIFLASRCAAGLAVAPPLLDRRRSLAGRGGRLFPGCGGWRGTASPVPRMTRMTSDGWIESDGC